MIRINRFRPFLHALGRSEAVPSLFSLFLVHDNFLRKALMLSNRVSDLADTLFGLFGLELGGDILNDAVTPMRTFWEGALSARFLF